MSIYSGFPTRRDQTKYNDLLSRLLLMLQHHLLEFIGNSELPHKKIVSYAKIISKMKDYEEHKYLPPKFTQLLDPLCKVIGFTHASVTVEEVVIDEDRGKGGLEKLKAMKLPPEKQRVKTKIEEEASEYSRVDTSSFQEQCQRPLSRPKKKRFEVNELKEKKLPHNINDFAVKDKIQIKPRTPHCNEESQQEKTKTEHSKISASHPLIGSVKSSKNYFRYRASNAMAEGQENISKRQVPLRQQMRRRLKSTGNGDQTQL